MSVLVVVMVALLGATTWVVQDQPWAARPALQRRLAEAGLTLSVLVVVVVTAAAVVTSQ
ncbi:hypothetical protein [Actinoplanes sp. URMC 104]|uniref:hypothetical protein n=1 Tax=Actinoplanes sp. URMC 104 TaxID=3423409 RepID=UPI003F1C64B0